MAAATNSIGLPTRLPSDEDDLRLTPPAGRGRILALAAGAGNLAATSAAAKPIENEPLVPLWAEYSRLQDLFKEACTAESATSVIAGGNHPARPRSLFGRKHETGALFELAVDDIIRWRNQAAAMKLPGAAIHERQLAAWHSWRAECDAVDAEHGLPELEARSTELLDESIALESRIAVTPAQTVRGVLIKLKLIDRIEEYSTGEKVPDLTGRLVLGVIADLEAATAGGLNHG